MFTRFAETEHKMHPFVSHLLIQHDKMAGGTHPDDYRGVEETSVGRMQLRQQSLQVRQAGVTHLESENRCYSKSYRFLTFILFCFLTFVDLHTPG